MRLCHIHSGVMANRQPLRTVAFITVTAAFFAISTVTPISAFAQTAKVEIQATPSENASQSNPPIVDGERFSTWMLKEQRTQNTKSASEAAT